MIVLDTHVWIWWLDGNPRLSSDLVAQIEADGDRRVSFISIQEIAVATSLGTIPLTQPVEKWLAEAETLVNVGPLTTARCISATRLPGDFHRDPADRLIVALAREFDCPLMTADRKILAYPHVKTIAV